MDDEERLWTRIREVCRLLSQVHEVDLPEKLLINTGSYWERDAQKRAALMEFIQRIPEAPTISADQPLSKIAETLDGFWLNNNADEGETEEE